MVIKPRDNFKDNLNPLAFNIQKTLRVAANQICQHDNKEHILQILTGCMAMIHAMLEPLVDKDSIN